MLVLAILPVKNSTDGYVFVGGEGIEMARRREEWEAVGQGVDNALDRGRGRVLRPLLCIMAHGKVQCVGTHHESAVRRTSS